MGADQSKLGGGGGPCQTWHFKFQPEDVKPMGREKRTLPPELSVNVSACRYFAPTARRSATPELVLITTVGDVHILYTITLPRQTDGQGGKYYITYINRYMLCRDLSVFYYPFMTQN